MKTGHGGKRAGAGKPKGHKAQTTLTKEAIRAEVQRRVAAALQPMVDAQIAHAQGLRYLVVRQKSTGKFVRVTEAMAKLREGEAPEDHETIEVWEKDPSVQAFTDLMNRAADKPIEAVQLSGLEGAPLVISWQSPTS